MRREETNFFGDGLKFWIGKVVSKKAQKLQLDGKGGVGDIKFVYLELIQKMITFLMIKYIMPQFCLV